MQLAKLLEVGRWFEAFPGPAGPLELVAVVAFGMWTAASIYLYLARRKVFAGKGALIGMVTRLGPYAIAIGVLGLFFLAMRYFGVPYLSIRFLLYLTILTAVGYLGFVVYYLRFRYPRRVAEVRAFEMRRRYSPQPKRGKRRR